MTPFYTDDAVTLFHGDCLEVLASLPDCSVDSVVTDPPYGLGFMGREWDDLPPGVEFAAECLRVLKPGGHMLAFGGSRTWHRLTCAIEDAGFEIRDSIAWLYGSGFPKSLDVSKAIDKAAGAEREVVGVNPRAAQQTPKADVTSLGAFAGTSPDLTAPATPDAQRWQGWGTALKPAFEPIVVARKPLAGTVAANVLTHGTGALNVDGCRVGTDERFNPAAANKPGGASLNMSERGMPEAEGSIAAGRWPPNVILDESQAAELDRQSGWSDSSIGGQHSGRAGTRDDVGEYGYDRTTINRPNDSGGASRFFPTFRYEPKAPTTERPRIKGNSDAMFAGSIRKRCTVCGKQEVNMGDSACACDDPDFQPDASMTGHISHPTVKPLDLMRWLVRLVTPPGGTVLEPFAGSGTTAEACVVEGFKCVAIEREADYLPLIVQRLTKPIQVALEFG